MVSPHTLMPVRVAVATNIFLGWDGTSTYTADGITLKAGDRIFAMGQTTTLETGIYILSTTFPRAYDMPMEAPLLNGMMVTCREGTSAGKILVVTFPTPGTPGPYGSVGIDTMTITIH